MANTSGSEDWRVLCELASKEMDSDRLMDLVAKINVALDQHNQRSRYGKVVISTIIPPHTTTTAV
jgi:hypothetical protein